MYGQIRRSSAIPVIVSALFLATGTQDLALASVAREPEEGPTSPTETARPHAAPELSGADLEEIRAAFSASRRAIRSAEGQHAAKNFAQQLETRFDRRGFSATPFDGDWTWGLELTGFGLEEGPLYHPKMVSTTISGDRLTRTYGVGLDEWYINGPVGLEHGYTVHTRPTGDPAERLTFHLDVRGELLARVSPNGRDVNFCGEDGQIVVRYSGLKVFDATGKPLAASFVAKQESLTLLIEQEGARYPLTIDPIAQQAKLFAAGSDSDDDFGSGLAVSGNTVAIGAPQEESNATGINGNQGNNGAFWSGAVYIFERQGMTWVEQAFIKSSNSEGADWFGCSVDLDGDTLLVGARGEDSSATGVNGDQADNGALTSGAAYVFVRNGGQWSQQAYLKASNTDEEDQFGVQVTLDGEHAAIGAYYEDGGIPGVNGDGSDNSQIRSGAVYTFRRAGTTWIAGDYLKASNTSSHLAFGGDLDMSGKLLVVGGIGDDSSATGVNGDQYAGGASSSGAAYVFRRGSGGWAQEAYLKAHNTGGYIGGLVVGDRFGTSVSVDGSTIAVGAAVEAGGSTGIDGPDNNDIPLSGAAYVFVHDGVAWSQQAYIKASNTGYLDRFGQSICVQGDRLVVGALRESGADGGINGNQANNSSKNAGAIYYFERQGTNWSQTAYIKADSPNAQIWFSRMVDLDGDILLTSGWAPSVFVFDLDAPPSPGSGFCFGDGSGNACPCGSGGLEVGCPNSATSGGLLKPTGYAQFNEDSFGLAISGLPGNKIGLCIKGSVQLGGGGGNPVGDGLLCTNPQLRSQVRSSNGFGKLTVSSWRGQPFGSYPGAANVGSSTYYQWWYRDPNNTCTGSGFNFTNTLRIIWQ